MQEIGITYMSGISGRIASGKVIAITCVTLAFYLALFVLRGIGLFVMAKKREIKGKALAFVPFLWVYVMAKLIGRAFFFGKEFKGFAVTVTVLATVVELLTLAINFLGLFPLIGYYLNGGDVVISLIENPSFSKPMVEYPFLSNVFVAKEHTLGGFVMPYANVFSVIKAMDVLGMIGDILGFVYMLATIFIYIYLFKKYWPRHFLLGVVLSFLVTPAFPIIIFCLRKKEPMTYEEYLRSIGVRVYNPYTANTNQTNNGQNPYNTPKETSPFEDFPDGNKTPEEPFSEFDTKD